MSRQASFYYIYVVYLIYFIP